LLAGVHQLLPGLGRTVLEREIDVVRDHLPFILCCLGPVVSGQNHGQNAGHEQGRAAGKNASHDKPRRKGVRGCFPLPPDVSARATAATGFGFLALAFLLFWPNEERESKDIQGKTPMTRQKSPEKQGSTIPTAVQPAHEAIVALTDGFCQEHLGEEAAATCRRMAGLLARKRPSPLTRGKPEGWACGIVRAVSWANFLDDPSLTPHVKSAEIDQAFGVSLATGHAKSKAIRDLLDVNRFDPEWTLPSRMEQNPLAWIISVNGLPIDARNAPREIQEEAYRKGLIPYLPGEEPDAPAESLEPEEEVVEEASEEAPEEFGPSATADA